MTIFKSSFEVLKIKNQNDEHGEYISLLVNMHCIFLTL